MVTSRLQVISHGLLTASPLRRPWENDLQLLRITGEYGLEPE